MLTDLHEVTVGDMEHYCGAKRKPEKLTVGSDPPHIGELLVPVMYRTRTTSPERQKQRTHCRLQVYCGIDV